MGYEKYILSTLIIIIFGCNSAHAQSRTDESNDKVSLNIVLYPIQTIKVNPNQKSVDLEYASKDDYDNGVSNKQEDHLTIYSTGGFVINVESAEAHIAGLNKNIDASDVKITATKGSNNELTDVMYNDKVALTMVGAELLSSKNGGVGQTFNIEYESIGEDAFINYFDDDSNPTVFTTTITYSIIAQ